MGQARKERDQKLMQARIEAWLRQQELLKVKPLVLAVRSTLAQLRRS